jgi:hypothetical protein
MMGDQKFMAGEQIEQIKENIESHSKGYNVSSLKNITSKPSGKIERERRLKYEELVANPPKVSLTRVNGTRVVLEWY